MRARTIVALLTLAALAAIPAAKAQHEPNAVAALSAASSAPVAVYRNPTTGAPYFLRARIAARKFSDATAVARRATDFWEAYGRLFRVRSAP